MFILIIILVVFITYKVIKYLDNSDKFANKAKFSNNNYPKFTNENILQTSSQNNNFDYKKYYKPKRYITTLNELKFYTVLLEIAKELDLILFSQVSLYNIIETNSNLDYKTKTIYFNKISSKSIDFVLVDKTNCKIRLCIELDDTTHKQEKRIERDKFINELFKSLEINLLRYPVYPVYYKDTLKRKIQENIKEHYY